MRNIFLVARRDYLGYVTAWGFWLGLLITPVLIGVFALAPTLVASNQPTRHFTVIETGTEFSDALQSEFRSARIATARAEIQAKEFLGQDVSEKLEKFDAAADGGATPEEALAAAGERSQMALPQADYIPVAPPARTAEDLNPWLMGERMVETENGAVPLFAAIIVPEDGPIEYWSENITDDGLQFVMRRAERKLAQDKVLEAAGVSSGILDDIEDATRDIEERRARPQGEGGGSKVTLADRAPYIAAVFMAFILWMLIFSVVNYLLMGTIEERSNKIFDSLLTSVKLTELLAGKLIAVLAVSLTLMTFWGLGGTIAAAFAGDALQGEAAANLSIIVSAIFNPAIIIPALISFLLGYLMYGSIFLALGSLCDTIQEAQTLMTPLLVLLMSPMLLFIVAIDDPTSPLVQIISWVPLLTPFLLIIRMPTEPAMWEVAAQLVMMLVTTLLILWLAAKVYRAGAVHGAGVSDVAAWFRKFVPFGKKKSV